MGSGVPEKPAKVRFLSVGGNPKVTNLSSRRFPIRIYRI